ncbi:aminoglycoside N(3)-acetyltransferase [Campylobacter lari]|uniref:Aminoglycoside N(3)-acetyltransferase n=1 Tax=Campylobacter lari TaxID=201 RepID=A0A5L4NMX2_CAMLA|nr:AAC(3) family N-acetyltransferase [Campylobacter sp. CNRCH_2013_0898h]EAI3905184.1 aminoglycoside N(3)-acetyltransferase [Campylobacter lari]EAI3913582.1 aminoglycoside N(3)-acetyltransferase [Campylobacter lari]EAJ6187513.1 aminoglycoside N(3)-acetyltransferase [Campylobacter lari]EAK0828394.1 aminoglycoside N(3)-acetyltransferase [Campylobacter lari]MCV3552750.1 AAC(3) family N-acetyltransferase [Campylobacter sp. CNRCH_2013_0898h]
MKYFLEYNDKKYSNVDLIEAFKKLGIKKGDILCVHSELFNFGTPLLPRNEFLQTILDCFFEVIGKEGTLIMPTFTYSFCKNEVYDKLNSPTKIGALNEYFRKQIGVKRTNDPIFSFAVKGAKEGLFDTQNLSCFGENSGYDILTKNNGKIIYFGLDWAHTFIHYIEEKFKVDYRYFKIFQGIIKDEKKEYKKEIQYYVRYFDRQSELNLEKINIILNNANIFSKIQFGGGIISYINTNDFERIIISELKKDKNILVN